ncbi:MAG: ferritin-like domain-containing protein, partial [Alphaproteobacteria bacterium]
MSRMDETFQTVSADDFPAMLDPDRYGRRSPAFDKIIAATHDHFWDPLDTRYIDFSTPFDLKSQYLVNPKLSAELQTSAVDGLSESQKIYLANRLQHYQISAIL